MRERVEAAEAAVPGARPGLSKALPRAGTGHLSLGCLRCPLPAVVGSPPPAAPFPQGPLDNQGAEDKAIRLSSPQNSPECPWGAA